jgi:hypothetical protein
MKSQTTNGNEIQRPPIAKPPWGEARRRWAPKGRDQDKKAKASKEANGSMQRGDITSFYKKAPCLSPLGSEQQAHPSSWHVARPSTNERLGKHHCPVRGRTNKRPCRSSPRLVLRARGLGKQRSLK